MLYPRQKTLGSDEVLEWKRATTEKIALFGKDLGIEITGVSFALQAGESKMTISFFHPV